MVKESLDTAGAPVEWLLGREEQTDTAKYMIFQVRHDVEDEDGRRFITAMWIYINMDSTKRRLYEYDLPNGTLILWNKPQGLSVSACTEASSYIITVF